MKFFHVFSDLIGTVIETDEKENTVTIRAAEVSFSGTVNPIPKPKTWIQVIFEFFKNTTLIFFHSGPVRRENLK